MPRHVRRTLGVVLLLVLAGCTAPTVSLSEAERPPGVREDHVDPAPLLAAHASVLADQSYAATVRVDAPNRSLTGVLRVGPAHEYATLHVTRRTPGATVETRYYVTPSRVYESTRVTRDAGANTSTRTYEANAGEVRQLRRQVGVVAAVRAAARADGLRPVRAVGHRGRTLVVLATNDSAALPLARTDAVAVRMAVSTRGVVHRVTFAAPAADLRATWRLARLGQTRVSRPQWVTAVTENRSRTPTRVSSRTRTAASRP